MTSHAAVVARGMGKPCVCGCADIQEIDEHIGYFKMGGKQYNKNDFITLNGSTGEIYEGQVKLVNPDINSGYFKTIMDWSEEFKVLKIRTNADVPRDAIQATEFGAEGIGLCRTEHMFFKGPRILSMRKMILSNTEQERRKYLKELLVYQKDDFLGLFETMKGKPVTIRFLDPPLHEFLP